MRTTFLIQRFNPETDAAPRLREYQLDIPWRGNTVLDALFQIKGEVDGSLTFRASCRSAICGSCPMVINGRERLACQTLVASEVAQHGRIEVRPLRKMRVIKDLAVELASIWEKLQAVTPYLTPRPNQPERWFPSRDPHGGFQNVDACILCGACVSACSSMEVSPGFLGPAALAKAYRFVADPREGRATERLERLGRENGIWDCVRCNWCVEVCPKDVQPMEAIIRLRRASIRAGLDDHPGATHITAFMDLVKHEGRLNEARMPVAMVWPDLKRLVGIVPLGLRMFRKGKVPAWFQRPIPGIQQIRRLFAARKERR